MKKCIVSLVLISLSVALFVLPVAASSLSGGYYLTADSALGVHTFYVPSEFASGSLTYDSSGNLFNLTDSSIYLYCPDYPGYSIYAPRFSGFQYRRDSGGYSYADLYIHDINSTNVEIYAASPVRGISVDRLLVAILVVLIIAVSAFVILRR